MKQLGVIYLILGMCVGAGLLGIPVATAQAKSGLSLCYIGLAWVIMTTGAWCLMQVCLRAPAHSHLITLCRQHISPIGQIISWLAYLLLLYCLLCAYLAACQDLVHRWANTHAAGMLTHTTATCLVTACFSPFIYSGITQIDRVNRLLMTCKLVCLALLLITLAPFARYTTMATGQWTVNPHAFLTILCAFGYAIIIPSIRDYLNNPKQLKRSIIIGSLVPVIIYCLWTFVIQGIIPREGRHGLLSMMSSQQTNSQLVVNLATLTHNPQVTWLSMIFIPLCSVTGFLAVSLCLRDFLLDGLSAYAIRTKRLLAWLLTIAPPTTIICMNPALFIPALSYAGLLCLYILVILPIVLYLKVRQQPKTISN